jgi:DNA-binding response OmpR family regulator
MVQRVLIVEDNPAHAKMLSYCLKHRGFQVACIENGDDVVSECESFRPDLVLMDIEIPGISGMEACMLLRKDKKFAKLPIFAVTAMNRVQFMHEEQHKHFDEYIEKPVILNELLMKINEYLARD